MLFVKVVRNGSVDRQDSFSEDLWEFGLWVFLGWVYHALVSPAHSQHVSRKPHCLHWSFPPDDGDKLA